MIFNVAIAVIEWGYFRAATLKNCVLSCDTTDHRWEITGTLAEAIAFRLTQRPLTLTVHLAAGGAMRWPIEELEEAGAGAMRARLGPRERRH